MYICKNLSWTFLSKDTRQRHFCQMRWELRNGYLLNTKWSIESTCKQKKHKFRAKVVFHLGLCLMCVMSETLGASLVELKQQTIAYMAEWDKILSIKNTMPCQTRQSDVVRRGEMVHLIPWKSRTAASSSHSVCNTGCGVVSMLKYKYDPFFLLSMWRPVLSNLACDTSEEPSGRQCLYQPIWLGLCSPLKTRSFPAPLSSKL